ncbi:hypothetical protein [Maribacter dokdonensis]|nr:hypothetical protein [Maribacter dokdonensis]KSA15222.1 hypothetical protein I600_1834 [Maribacter dokdonensis DSW-8]
MNEVGGNSAIYIEPFFKTNEIKTKATKAAKVVNTILTFKGQ